MRDTFADLLREAGLVSEATQATRGRVPYRNAPRPLPPSMRGPTVIPRAEIDRDTAQRQAFAPPRNQIREAASMAGEMVGTEPLARGVMALRGDLTGRPEPGRAAGEFGMAAVNLGLGALGLADDVGALRAAAPRPLPALRAIPESAPRPTPPPRQPGLWARFNDWAAGQVQNIDDAQALQRELRAPPQPSAPRYVSFADVSDAEFEQMAEAARMAANRGELPQHLANLRAQNLHPDVLDELRYRATTGNISGMGPGRAAETNMAYSLRTRLDALDNPPPTPPPRQASRSVAWSDLPIETQHDLAILRGDTAPAADTILYRRQLDDLAPDLTVENIRLSDIPGVDLEDATRVRRYSRLSSPPPPIVVFRRSDGSLGLLNGNHRRLAQAARGTDTIPAVVLSEADVSLFPGIETRRATMANQRPPRQIGRASDGSVLPVREPQPMRQSFVGGSDDLREAARLNNRPDPHGEGVGADMRRPLFPGRRK